MFSIDKKYSSGFHNTALWVLLIVGFMQIAGYLLKNRQLRGLGMSYGVAPLPTVFSTIKGVEGFDTKHTIHFLDQYGKQDSIEINRQVFSNFKGHFFLKDAYSIFLAYPHVLKQEQLTDGWNFALCKKNLLIECDLSTDINNPFIRTTRKNLGKNETLQIIPECNSR